MPNIQEVKKELLSLKNEEKFERMLFTAAILTNLLKQYDIKPIIVGGLSVEIYTLNQYTTQDIDFVLDGREKAGEILFALGFEKVGKEWIHSEIGVSIEIHDSNLAGDYDKVTEIPVKDKVVHVIGIEDIILDRLRAAVRWRSGEDREWGYRLLYMYHENLNLQYIRNHFENQEEESEFNQWLDQLKK